MRYGQSTSLTMIVRFQSPSACKIATGPSSCGVCMCACSCLFVCVCLSCVGGKCVCVPVCACVCVLVRGRVCVLKRSLLSAHCTHLVYNLGHGGGFAVEFPIARTLLNTHAHAPLAKRASTRITSVTILGCPPREGRTSRALSTGGQAWAVHLCTARLTARAIAAAACRGPHRHRATRRSADARGRARQKTAGRFGSAWLAAAARHRTCARPIAHKPIAESRESVKAQTTSGSAFVIGLGVGGSNQLSLG
jgi:hypothetical protein